ncbi:hypothetical protein DINM_003351 [Dirofilaria immitis]|nr:hypothetical protein [Dirofilaria immitis]
MNCPVRKYALAHDTTVIKQLTWDKSKGRITVGTEVDGILVTPGRSNLCKSQPIHTNYDEISENLLERKSSEENSKEVGNCLSRFLCYSPSGFEMTVEKLPPNEFIVKVRRGRMDRPVYMKRRAVMIFNHDQKDITFSYDNCCTILKAKFISQMPWSPPRGCTLRFMSDNRNEEEMILEFENHGKLIEAFSILKSKYLERSQFVYLSEPRSGRGLHTTAESAAERPVVDKTFSIVMESRRNRVKDHMFERLASPPSEKRSKQFEQPHKLMQTPIEERVKPPPLRSEGSENIRRNQRDAMFVEYSKREHTALKLTSAMRTLDDYKITKSNISSEKVSGFANLGNTCYMNAMLQALFAMDIFARDLFKLCKKVQNRNVDLEEVMPMSSALSNLASIRDRVSYHQKRELLKVIKDVSRFKDCAQQDANEFLIHVLNQVHDECDRLLHEQYGIADAGERRKRNPVMANFAFTTRSTVVCDVCHHVSQTDEDSIILPVTINVLEQANERFSKKFLRFPSVQTLLDEYLKTENVERKCEVCEGNIGQRTQKFVQLPRCLIIFIKRYTYDVSRSVKRDDKVDIPLYLTLNGHCAESSAPCLAIPTSTKKIDFATTSPIKMKLSTISIDPPSSARRRLDLSDEITNHDARKVSIAKEAMTSRYNRPMEYRTVWTNTAANHCMDFVIPGIDSNLKDEDQVTEDFVVPRNSTDEQSKSSSSLICKELSHVDEEEQLQVNDESEVLRGLIENSYNDCVENSKQERRSSDTGIFEETNEQDGRNRQKVKPVIQQKERNGVEEYTETNSGVELGITNVTKEVAMKETVVMFNLSVNAEQTEVFEETHIRSLAQSAIAANQLEEQGQDGRLIEQIVVENFGIPCSVQRKTTLSSIENRKTQTPTRPSSPISSITLTSMIGHYREKVLHRSTSNDDTREILEESGMQLVPYKPMSAEKRRAICSQIGLLFNYDCIEGTTVRIMSPNDRPSRVAGIVGDGNCLFRALAFYFAGSDNEHSRVRKCVNFENLLYSEKQIMVQKLNTDLVKFEPEMSAITITLLKFFRFTEYYYAWGGFMNYKLARWSSEIWNDHMNQLLTDNTWGTEIELFAVAAMLNVDVWTYYDQRWICYRPRFKVQNGGIMPISICDYRLGDNDGIYLLNEFNHFTPVLEPSNALLVMEGADERICDLIINANEGFMKPSYRLISVISHLGNTSESGHYVCDIWCKKIRIGCCATMNQFHRSLKQGYELRIMSDTSIFILIGDFLKTCLPNTSQLLRIEKTFDIEKHFRTKRLKKTSKGDIVAAKNIVQVPYPDDFGKRLYDLEKVMNYSVEDYGYLMNINLRSIVQLMRKARPYLIKTKGSIVSVNSINGPCPVLTIYLAYIASGLCNSGCVREKTDFCPL